MAKSIFQKKKKKQRSIKKRNKLLSLFHKKKKTIQLKSTTSKLFMHKPEHTGENLL